MIHSYPWYFADWLGSETRLALTPEGRGIYRDLLDKCWEQGSLPSDERMLAKLADCQIQALRRCWPIIQKHFTERDGRLYNQRVDADRPRLINWKEARRAAGRKGGENRSKTQAIASSKTQAIASSKTQANPKPSSSSSSSSSLSPYPLSGLLSPHSAVGDWVEKIRAAHPKGSSEAAVAVWFSEQEQRLGNEQAFNEFAARVYRSHMAYCEFWAETGRQFANRLEEWLTGGYYDKTPPRAVSAQKKTVLELVEGGT